MKSKKLILLLLTIASIASGFIMYDHPKIGENGIVSLKLEESNLKDIKKVFPKGEKVVRKVKMQSIGHALLTSHECIEIKGKKHTAKFVTYIDEKNGLIFNLGMANNLRTISFVRPSNYQTIKGIGVLSHTFNDLDSVYGVSPWVKHISGNCKTHDNLLFFPHDSIAQSNLSTDELNALNVSELLIDKIELYKPIKRANE